MCQITVAQTTGALPGRHVKWVLGELKAQISFSALQAREDTAALRMLNLGSEQTGTWWEAAKLAIAWGGQHRPREIELYLLIRICSSTLALLLAAARGWRKENVQRLFGSF